jgi:hypothetical protein
MAVEFTLYPLCMDSDAMAEYIRSGDLTAFAKKSAGVSPMPAPMAAASPASGCTPRSSPTIVRR